VIEKVGRPFIEKLNWNEARQYFEKANPVITKIIDDIWPTQNHHLLKIRYPFGALILNDTKFQVPSKNGKISPLIEADVSSEIKQMLGYCSLPLGLVIKNNVEIYRDLEDRIFPVAFYGHDIDMGIWEYFGWVTPYNVSAGARSLYMVPKISSSVGHKRLRQEFGVTPHPPKKPFDHWEIFRQIANSSNFPESWNCEIVFLTKAWFDSILKDKAWFSLNDYLWRKGWQHCGYARIKTIFDALWQHFVKRFANKGFRVDPYIMDTLKHLLYVGTSAISAFGPMGNDDVAGPLKTIQRVYKEVYGLKDYVPTIMQPQYLEKNNPIYYSLSMPTLLETLPKSRNRPSTIEMIRELKGLIQYLFQEIDIDLKIQNTPLNEILFKLQFEYFHNEMYAYGKNIRPASEMPDKDHRLLYCSSYQKCSKFSDSGPLVQGCIRINQN